MAWYTVKTYERSGGPGSGQAIDISIFEALSDEEAVDQLRKRSLLSVSGDFANLLNAADKIISTTDGADA